MRAYSIFTVIALFVLACSGDTTQQVVASEEGAKVYKTYCTACHGADGSMQLNGAKDFKESILTLEERIDVITNGSGAFMQSFKPILNEKEIKAVAEYTIYLTQQRNKE